jgi:hypothetical protein
VSDEDDRLAQARLEAQELVLQALAGDRVDRAERLVHQQQRRVGGQRARDADALLLAAGELRGIAVAHLERQPDELEQLVDALADALLVPAEHARQRGDVVGDRAVREQADVLDRVADVAPQLVDRAVVDAAAVDQDLAVGDLDHPVHQAHRGGLAAAGGADEHADLTGVHREAEVLDRRLLLARVALGHVPELERRGGLGLPAALLVL